LEVLPALNQLVHGLEKQLESLADLPINQHPDESPMEGRE